MRLVTCLHKPTVTLKARQYNKSASVWTCTLVMGTKTLQL